MGSCASSPIGRTCCARASATKSSCRTTLRNVPGLSSRYRRDLCAPTDVDTKIRGIVWNASRDPDVLRAMLRLALASRAWTEDGISIRAIRGVSGHNGEQWSAIANGLGTIAGSWRHGVRQKKPAGRH